MASPPTQKDRPIGLLITDASAPVWFHLFHPRPEEVDYRHPTRATVIHTLEDGWADDFGQGLVEITVQGTTGWRGAAGIPGEAMAYNLRNAVNQLYHELREAHRAAGTDPDLVEMLWVDTLNVCAYVVYPTDFRLRRHKQRPLLYQYTMRLTALREFFSLNSGVGAIADFLGDLV